MPTEADATALEAHKKKPAMLKTLHAGLPKDSMKHKVGSILESWQMELFIIFLVICDVVLLGIEHGIDSHSVCIQGFVAPASPATMATLADDYAAEHGHSDHGLHDPHAEHHDEHHDDHSTHHEHHDGGHHAHLALSKTKSRVDLARALAVATPNFLQVDETSDELHALKLTAHETSDELDKFHALVLAADENPHHYAVDELDQFHALVLAAEENPHHHVVDKALVCETKWGPHAHELHHFCHTLSVAILVIMLIEILTKMFLDFEEFTSSPFEMLDLVVVSLSLIVDVFVLPNLTTEKDHDNAELVLILLVMCRFWRVVRIFHGVFEIVHHEVEKIHELKHRIGQLEGKIVELGGEVPEEKEHHGASVEEKESA